MAIIHYHRDIDPAPLRPRTIAVIGFGSQGHAHALNLHDTGHRVVVGLRPDSPRRAVAERHGLRVADPSTAAAEAGVVVLLAPDEHHAALYREIAAHLNPGALLLVAHGFSLLYGQISPPPGLDVALVAPKGPGHLVRREFLAGRGVPALLAVHQDATGRARSLALAYAAGIGSARAGILETTIREETETDLFGEQAVLCGGVTALMKAGFDTLVEAGYQPEMAYFECVHEMKLIVDLIYEGGFTRMRDSISTTAEYGDYLAQESMAGPQLRETMAQILRRIRTGRFARDWVLENQAGRPSFHAWQTLEREQPLEQVGRRLRAMMPWARPEDDDDHPA